MGYVVFALIILAFVGMGVWDHRTRKKGHTLRKDGMSEIRAARRRDAPTGPSSTYSGIPRVRDHQSPPPPEDPNRLRR